ncbi:MAG: hypothetical protein HN981_03710 [Candidatus Pacebacteria bacterium]|jgi:hypothetical protein|nr:hypothetical protein [Candidatus Paceibacterota bacterium]MBT4652304.1 hypothetical protein [Candidatus Paceibacterota bacterium]MBT6756497.1 hypothetical protein [Candidatus Paceibacterota bacterium]MBT6921470.1 hypothetical protein [Candidatus Paceibacterota bacterium]
MEINPYLSVSQMKFSTEMSSSTELLGTDLKELMAEVREIIISVLKKTEFVNNALEKIGLLDIKTIDEEIIDLFWGRCTTFSGDLKRALRTAGLSVNTRENPSGSHTFLAIGRGEKTIIIDPTMPQIIKGFKGIAVLSWSQLESLVLDKSNKLSWSNAVDRKSSLESIWGRRSGRNSGLKH